MNIIKEEKRKLSNEDRASLAVLIRCEYCNKKFWKHKRFFEKYGHHFCTSKCSNMFRRNRVTLTCDYCGQKFQRVKSKLKNSQSGLHFCSRKCKDKAQRIENSFTDIHPDHYNKNGKNNYRQRAFRLYGKKCANCGYNQYDAGLDVHHIDGNRSNNSEENLIVLCATCHVLITRNVFEINENREMIPVSTIT